MIKIKPIFQKFFSERYNLYLTLLIVFHIIFFSIFHILNKNYQTWDSAGHIGLSYRMADEIKRFSSGVEEASISSIMKVSNYYPPFVQLVGSFISLIFGYKSAFLLIETLIFFLLSIIFTYKISLILTENKKISLLTTVIYSLFPQIIDQSHYFHLDIPLTTLVLISIYFLIKSDNFKKIWPTILFFIFLSFIQLTKWIGFIFLVAPVVIVLYKAFFKRDVDEKDNRFLVLGNLIIGSVLFLFIVFPWYYVNWKELITQVRLFSVGESDDPQNLWASLMYYPANAISHQIMFLPFILVFVSIVNLFKNDSKKSYLILFNILVPWLLFVFISNKNLRYTLPLAPLLAYLIADILLKISTSEKVKSNVFTIFTIVYLLAASFFLSFFRMERESPMLKPISMFFTGPRYNSWYYYGTYFYAYKPYRYPIDEVLDYIYQDANETEEALGVATLVDSEEMSAAMLEVVRMENGYRNMYMPVPYFQFEPFRSVEEIEAFFYETGAKYVITSTNIGPEGLRNYVALRQATDYLEENSGMFLELRDFNVYKNRRTSPFDFSSDEAITIYKRKSFVSKAETPEEGCKFGAGIDDGIETIKLSPNHTYVLYTGHFAIQDKVWKDFERGVTYVVQIENTIHQSLLDVHNLPKSGSSFCSIEGLNKDFSEEIRKILTEEDKCGVGIQCHKVIHVKWSVGDPRAEITEYTSDSID